MLPGISFPLGILVVLGSAFIGGFVAEKLKLPTILGYFISGIFVSGLLTNLGWERGTLSILAEVGLALLMFCLGLEFSWRKAEKSKKRVYFGAFLQVVFTAFLGTILLKNIFGLDLKVALIGAAAFSLSSTAMVVKFLQGKNLSETLPGEIMITWLLVQDLLSLPLSGVLPVFLGQGDWQVIINTLFNSSLILFFTLLCGWKIVPYLTDLVASFKNRELLLIFVVILIFIFSLLTASLGFSFVIGAFLAGLVLNQTNENHAIFSQIRPFRDVFLAIFFVSLGLSLSPSFVITNFGKILSISLLVLTLKFVLISGILVYFGYHAKVILDVGLGLSQVGEFSFAFAATAFSQGFLDSFGYSLITSVALVTVALTPSLFQLSGFLYRKSGRLAVRFPFLYRKFFSYSDQRLPLEELPFENHVVVLGYGRVGKWVSNILEEANIPYLVVEYNPQIVRELKLEGKKVVFGDPSDIDVLDYAQVDKAKMVILAIPDTLTQKIAVTHCRSLNSRVEILCRSHLKEDHRELKSLGVDFIIQPEFEAALSISHRILQEMGFGKEEIGNNLREARKKHEKDSNE